MSTRSLGETTAADIMQTDVTSVPSSMPIAEVERVLADIGVGGAPVTDASGCITGVVSLRDIADYNAQQRDAGRAPTVWQAAIEDPQRAESGPFGAGTGEDVESATPADIEGGIAGEIGAEQWATGRERGAPEIEERELQRMATGESVPEQPVETVAEIMSGEVHTVDTDTPLPAIADRMVDRVIHRLLVRRPRDGRIVGIVSSMDVVRAVAGAVRS